MSDLKDRYEEVQRYHVYNVGGDDTYCRDEDVAKLEAKYAELESKYKKLGEYCYQLYRAAGDLTSAYIEIEPEELKEQAKQVLRNFEKDPIFWEIIA